MYTHADSFLLGKIVTRIYHFFHIFKYIHGGFIFTLLGQYILFVHTSFIVQVPSFYLVGQFKYNGSVQRAMYKYNLCYVITEKDIHSVHHTSIVHS